MRIAVFGRTEMLYQAAVDLAAAGHQIGLVATCRASGHELRDEKDFEALATAHGAPFLMGPRLETPEKLAVIREAGCDVGVSMNWLTLIPSAVRALLTHGLFNAHPGDLPRYKGNACPNWAMLRGDHQVVLALHRMVDALDAGPIALRRSLPLGDETTIAEVYDWLRRAIPEAYVDMVARLERGDLPLEEQPADQALGLRCYPRRPEDGRIDWSQPAELVCRLVRASGRPFAGAFSHLEGQRRVTVWSARMWPDLEPFVAAPGQIAYAVEGDPVVCCGSGYLRLTEIEIEGAEGHAAAAAAVLSSLRNRLT